MPVYVNEMTTDVTVVDGELPLDEVQIRKLVNLVVERLERRHRETEQGRAATELRPGAAPPAYSNK